MDPFPVPVGEAAARCLRQLLDRFLQRRPLRLAAGGGEPPVCSKIRALGPPAPKAAAHRPMVCGSRSSAAAVAAALQPWASNKMAYHRSRSRGVGARIIRRRKSLTSICHCSKDRSISLTLIIYPPPTTAHSGPVPPQIYPIFLRISPRLWFSTFAPASPISRANIFAPWAARSQARPIWASRFEAPTIQEGGWPETALPPALAGNHLWRYYGKGLGTPGLISLAGSYPFPVPAMGEK